MSEPTDDEREALRIAHLDARQAAYRKEVEDWCVDHDYSPEIAGNAFFRGWDAAVDGGFRRSEVPELQGEPSRKTVSPNPEDYPDHTEHPDYREPQGEPTDAQVEAGLRAWFEGRTMLNLSNDDSMRAALRAAGVVAEEPEWEYGVEVREGDRWEWTEWEGIDVARESFPDHAFREVKRRPPGCSVPVEQEGQS